MRDLVEDARRVGPSARPGPRRSFCGSFCRSVTDTLHTVPERRATPAQDSSSCRLEEPLRLRRQAHCSTEPNRLRCLQAQAAMSFAQEHSSALPPPPTSAPPSPLVGYYPQQTHAQTSSPLRRIAVQPPILTTQLAPPPTGHYSHGHTPASATSVNASFSPYAPSPSIYTASPVVPPSPMATRNPGYNPQQWARSGGTVGGQYLPHLAPQTPVATRPQDVSGLEGT